MTHPRTFTAGALLAIGLLLMPALASAQQNVDDNDIFELEGNPQDEASAGEDWHTYFNTLHPAPNNFGSGAADAVTFIAETGNVSIFTQGGSKDINGVGQWRHTAGSVPDKDDIQNAYAAAYIVNNQLLLYFGADRTANNGDANIGFWFFQSHVGLNANGTFSGAHQDGDIFVVSGFTSGGQTSEIEVYEWSCPGNPADCDAVGELVFIAGGTNAQCNASSSGSFPVCAIANTGDVTSVWAYTPKAGTEGTFPVASFFEGGLNVTQVLGATPCISSFMVETRSSTSTTAQLKDFVLGNFELCGLEVTKTCPADGVLNTGGASIHYTYTGTATNSGAGTLANVTLIDTLPSGTVANSAVFKKGTPAIPPAVPGAATTTVAASACPAGSPASAVCANLGSLNGGEVINWSLEIDSTSTSAENNVNAVGFVGSNTVTADAPAKATCTITPNNDITITKNCGVPAGHLGTSNPATALPDTQLITDGSVVAVQVNFSGQVCNTGQTKLSGITLTDSPTATPTVAWPGTSGELNPGACAKYSGSYKPSSVTLGDAGCSTTGRYSFADEIKVTGATATFGSNPAADATCTSTFATGAQACAAATCSICPLADACNTP